MCRRRFILALVTTALAAGCGQEPSGPEGPPAGMPLNAAGAASAGFGGIAIVLDAEPNSALDVPFVTMGRKLKDFVLDDDADATLASSRAFSRLKAGAYTIQQPPTAGLPSLRIACTSDAHGGSGTNNNTTDLPNRRMTIQLERDETVVCTYRVGPWQTGDLVTYSQSTWGELNATPLTESFDNVYPPRAVPGMEVGISGVAGFSILFTLGDAVVTYLPAAGGVGSLTGDLLDPSNSASGAFGGEVTALQLNVDFSEAGVTLGANQVPLGDLTICAFSLLPAVNGLTAGQFLGIANTLLGGGSSGIVNISQAATIANFLNFSFVGGAAAPFAQENLVTGACP